MLDYDFLKQVKYQKQSTLWKLIVVLKFNKKEADSENCQQVVLTDEPEVNSKVKAVLQK